MSNPWFRMYAEFANDPKVQMMSEAYQRRLLILLCMRCNGNVTLQDEQVAFQLRIETSEWVKTKAEFIQRGFIDELNNVLNWDKRQYRSDSSLERVKRHREAKKTKDVTPCNVTVTPPDTEQNRAEAEKKNRLKNKLILPDWLPSEAWVDYLAMRIKIGKPATEKAISIAISKLNKLRGEGHDPSTVLENSIFNSYQGLFAPSENRYAKSHSIPTRATKETKTDRLIAAASRANAAPIFGFEEEPGGTTGVNVDAYAMLPSPETVREGTGADRGSDSIIQDGFGGLSH